MENAFNELISTGVVGAFLVIVIIYHLRTVKELKAEMKAKSEAHAEQMAKKDEKIEELHEKTHNLALKNVSTMKDWIEQIRSLRTP